jgi:hypothetical protein
MKKAPKSGTLGGFWYSCERHLLILPNGIIAYDFMKSNIHMKIISITFEKRTITKSDDSIAVV